MALEAGAELVICVNPIVPVDTVHAVEAGMMKKPNLLDRGLPTVLSQTFRTIIHSRLEVGMAAYETKFKDADVVLIEPQRDDYLMFFTNIFGFAERQAVCEYAYDATRRDLLARFDELAPIFASHGVTLRRDVLEEKRNLWQQVQIDRDRVKLATLGQPHRPPAGRRPRPAGEAAGAEGSGGGRPPRRPPAPAIPQPEEPLTVH